MGGGGSREHVAHSTACPASGGAYDRRPMPRLVAALQLLFSVLLAALSGVLAKQALSEVPPFTFVWTHVGVGGAVLCLYTFGLRRQRIPRGLGRGIWMHLLCIGVVNYAVVRLFFMLALERVPATTHAYLINFVGLATMGMSVIVLRERPGRTAFVGALLAFAGLGVYFREVPTGGASTGVLFAAIAVIGLATTNNVARRLALVTDRSISNDVVSTVAFLVGGVPVVLAGILVDGVPSDLGARNTGIVALNGIVSIAIGLTVINHVLRTLRSYEVSLLASTGMIFTALFAIPLLGERLVVHEIAGIAMMLVGVGMAQVRRR